MGPGPRSILVAACVALLGACTAMLEMDQPQLVLDSGIDASPDAASNVSPDARECPPAPAGCTAFRCAATSSCYYACSGTVSWSAAQSYCTQVGCLATIESLAEQECIAAATNPTNASAVWIGSFQATAQEPDGGWMWACGASSYTSWAAYEPNDLYGNEDCAAMASGGHWYDTTCSYDRRFVCELP
jgi:hypothetical protein